MKLSQGRQSNGRLQQKSLGQQWLKQLWRLAERQIAGWEVGGGMGRVWKGGWEAWDHVDGTLFSERVQAEFQRAPWVFQPLIKF